MPSGWGDREGHEETRRWLVRSFVALTRHAGLDILSDIIAHVQPVIMGSNMEVGFGYAEVASRRSVMKFLKELGVEIVCLGDAEATIVVVVVCEVEEIVLDGEGGEIRCEWVVSELTDNMGECVVVGIRVTKF